MTDDEKAALEEVISDLDGICVFQFCPGPDEPFEDMMTCRVCSSVQTLRGLLK